MTDPFSTPPATPPDAPKKEPPLAMAEEVVERLRSYAKGNGLMPEEIVLLGSEESVVSLPGRLVLDLSHDVEHKEMLGEPKGKNIEVMASVEELQAKIAEKQKEFKTGAAGIESAIEEIKKHPHQGWGLDNARVTIPDQSCLLAASRPCPSCGGQQSVVCPQCQGQAMFPCAQCQQTGKEVCPSCLGQGHYPGQPNSVCQQCYNLPLGNYGMHSIVCRACGGRGVIPCPACRGAGRLPCQTCRGAGKMSVLVKLSAYAKTTFRLEKGSEIPSGVLQAIHRFGMPTIAKGHATIGMTPPHEDEGDPLMARSFLYEAKIPYADARIRFGKSKAFPIGVFGNKKMIMNCPAFLDHALRETLRALKDPKQFDKAMQARIVRDAVILQLGGKGRPDAKGANDLRRLYPVGLSPDAATEILRGVAQGLKAMTLRQRVFAALSAMLIAILFSAAWILLSIKIPMGVQERWAADAGMAAVLSTLVWFGVGGIAKRSLKKSFPEAKIVACPFIGKTGLIAVTAVFILYAAFYYMVRFL